MQTARARDIVVVGSGAGGLVAALRAHEVGARVTIVEALDRAGGATAFSEGQGWVGANHVMGRLGLQDSPQDSETCVRAIEDERTLVDERQLTRWLRAGLYAVGVAAPQRASGTGYDRGFSLSRAITFGYVAATHAMVR